MPQRSRLATWHPSAVLRAPGERRQQAQAELAADLAMLAAAIAIGRQR